MGAVGQAVYGDGDGTWIVNIIRSLGIFGVLLVVGAALYLRRRWSQRDGAVYYSVLLPLHGRISRSPGAAVLAALLLVSLYGSYQRGRELTVVCKNLYKPKLVEWYTTKPKSDLQRAEMICSRRLSDD